MGDQSLVGDSLKDFKNSIRSSELKNSIKSFKSGLSHAEERIIKFKDRSFEINQLEEYNGLSV